MRVRILFAWLAMSGAVLGQGLPEPVSRKVDFLKEVQPILTEKCFGCHSGDKPQGGLKAHTREDLIRGGANGPAVVPGKSGESLLVRKIAGREGLRMPPAGPPLSGDTIAVIRAWIDQGATWEGTGVAARAVPLAPRNPPLPPGKAAHPVDRFMDAYFAGRRFAPPAPVGDALFARRAWFDISGLPPAPDELEAFLRDRSEDKRGRLVERLLSDRRKYAENWISFWNDMLRNDEGVIYHGERKTITKWLLGALESNMPYDAMVRALLNPTSADDPEGFLVGVNWRGVVSASQKPPMQAAQNSAQVFLGINLKCAACHDSFVNRWKLRDTFGLAAMFSDDKLELVRCDVPMGVTADARFPYPELKVAFDGTLESRRRAAAVWFTHPENGRFTRTIVNRYWKRLLGRGLVEPADDMDAEPWNADLLDWLASDFASHGYDLQHLLRRIMTSRAYQLPAALEKAELKDYVFRGPRLRRLTAEQFEDTVSAVTGDWRVSRPRAEATAAYTREWRLKSDPLSRALGRPIRDQVYTERASEATTLQALEMTNGPLLSARLERGAHAMLGQVRPSPANRFDSKLIRGGTAEVDADISGAKELWLLVHDVDSYDPARVIAGWVDAQLLGPGGAVKLSELPARQPVEARELHLKDGTVAAIGGVPGTLVWDIAGRGFTRFRARAAIDERSRASDISPALRFFVFTEKPDPDRLIRIEGEPPLPAPQVEPKASAVADRLYLQLMARRPSAAERKTALAMLAAGGGVAADGLEDLLWALLMSPEFQYIH